MSTYTKMNRGCPRGEGVQKSKFNWLVAVRWHLLLLLLSSRAPPVIYHANPYKPVKGGLWNKSQCNTLKNHLHQCNYCHKNQVTRF